MAARTRELGDLVAGLESFSRNVSHDLRDPLAGLCGLAQLSTLALQRGDAAQAQRHLQTIHAQSLQMSGAVQDLLRLSRVADAPLQRRRHALARSVDDALAQLRLSEPMASALERVRLQRRPLPECEVDADLMRQVFVNLLGNALKFAAARDGGGRVSVGPCPTPQVSAVCVEDDGLGLPPGGEAELFRPFVRLHGGMVPGSGLGLTIVRRIVEAHGGRVWAERAAGDGTRILFTLQSLG